MHYVFFPSGRKIWIDVALELRRRISANPVAWIGDQALDDAARNHFPTCEVVNFEVANYRISEKLVEVSGGFGYSYRNRVFHEAKLNAIKMMDRQDPYGAYRLVDREADFNSMWILSLNHLRKWKPDFLLFCESPHSPFQFTMYCVATYLKIPVFSFASWGIAPFVHIRSGIHGRPVKNQFNNAFPISAHQSLTNFSIKFSQAIDQFDPDYMVRQKRIDAKSEAIYEKLKGLAIIFYRTLKGVSNRREKGVLKGSCLHRFESLLRHFVVGKIKKEIEAERLRFEVDKAMGSPYVYFPLHYEPERTTLPDGGAFCDQFTALVALRDGVPEHIPIFVKEHYSQTTSSLQGFKGRSPAFYSLITSLKNVYLVPMNFAGKQLIAGSLLTATISGTAGLEAACMGVPALVFGNAWYLGAPGVTQYHEGVDISLLLSIDRNTGVNEVLDWMMSFSREYASFGCINPSNERLFFNHYGNCDNENVKDHEIAGLCNLVVSAIGSMQGRSLEDKGLTEESTC